jgi:hypothetical protein
MNKVFVSGCLPAAPITLPTAHALFSKRVCPPESLGDSQKGFQICNQRKKGTLQPSNFKSMKILLFNGELFVFTLLSKNI